VRQELPHHRHAANPLIEALLTREVSVPQVNEAGCLTYYRNHPMRFTRGARVEARRILFQVTPTVPLDLVRDTSEEILAALRAAPERFTELAVHYANCPSDAVGVSPGQLSRRDCVPEFDVVLFRHNAGEFAAFPVETRASACISCRSSAASEVHCCRRHGEIADRLVALDGHAAAGRPPVSAGPRGSRAHRWH
jgi:hypothetical protein